MCSKIRLSRGDLSLGKELIMTGNEMVVEVGASLPLGQTSILGHHATRPVLTAGSGTV
jgi:hypothetical protein